MHPGEWVTLTAQTSPIPSSFPPEGTVTFYDGGTPIPGCDEMQIAGEGGATFCETPREEAYGTVVVFQDLYGNKWDLLQLK